MITIQLVKRRYSIVNKLQKILFSTINSNISNGIVIHVFLKHNSNNPQLKLTEALLKYIKESS